MQTKVLPGTDRAPAPRCLSKIALWLAALLFVSAGPMKGQEGRIAGYAKLTAEDRKWVNETLGSLSLEEKIGQMLQVRYFGDYKSFTTGPYLEVREEIQKYHIGSVVLGVHFNGLEPVRSSPLAEAMVANQLQRDAKLPLIIAADLERGAASRFTGVPSFPWAMAFGAIGDAAEVERFGAITAREARAVGIQWVLAPVADVNSNSANPIINTRSFGEDPEEAGTMIAAFIRGAHSNGLLVTAKHFPGHGQTAVDSHYGVPVISVDLAHMQRVELPPFKRAIDAGVDFIMLAHASVPALEADPGRVATFSPVVVSGLLKGRLGFQGVVVTDALEMRSVSNMYERKEGGENPTAHAVVDAVKAGDDVIMLPKDLDAAYHGLLDAVRSNEISESRIDESVRKVLEMKAAVGLHRSRFVDLAQVSSAVNRTDDFDFAQHIADEAITLVRDNGTVLPLESGAQKKNPIAVILITDSVAGNFGHEFERVFRSRRPDAEIFYLDDQLAERIAPQVLKAVEEAQKVVVVVYVVHSAAQRIPASNAPNHLFGSLDRTGGLLLRILETAPDKTAVAAVNPYLIESFPQIRTYMCTYAMVPTSEISLVKALFGEIQNGSKLPVT